MKRTCNNNNSSNEETKDKKPTNSFEAWSIVVLRRHARLAKGVERISLEANSVPSTRVADVPIVLDPRTHELVMGSSAAVIRLISEPTNFNPDPQKSLRCRLISRIPKKLLSYQLI